MNKLFNKKTKQNDENMSKSDVYETCENFRKSINSVNSNEVSLVASTISKFNDIESKNPISYAKSNQICKMCDNDSDSSYIILSCNHVFHIKCIADKQHEESKKLQILDDLFFNNQKCYCCDTIIETSEILFIHSKFFKNTKMFIDNHNDNILNIEEEINKLKNELNTCLKYKQKLEYEREKSKQIINMVNSIVEY